jgi:hypothetical protein
VVWLFAIAVVLFIGCCVVAVASFLLYWQHLAKWLRPRYGRRPLPFYWDLLDLTWTDFRRLFSTEPDEKAHERAAARTHLVRAVAAVVAGMLLVSLVLVVGAFA